MNLSKSLRVALAIRNLNQSDLAELSGVSRVQISNISTEKCATNSRTIDAICKALDIKVSDFIALGEREIA